MQVEFSENVSNLATSNKILTYCLELQREQQLELAKACSLISEILTSMIRKEEEQELVI